MEEKISKTNVEVCVVKVADGEFHKVPESEVEAIIPTLSSEM